MLSPTKGQKEGIEAKESNESFGFTRNDIFPNTSNFYKDQNKS